MNRETGIAVIFGIGLGALVGIIIFLNVGTGTVTKVIPVAKNEKVQIEKPSSKVIEKEGILKLKTPEDKIVVDAKEITVSGSTTPKSLIIIQSPVSRVILKNDKEEFKSSFPLAVGENNITVSTYKDSNTPQEKSVSVYYIPTVE
ncbi:hypothetical protein COV58_04460 [Candidatus Roizmanbacteria bacterium CG11_big_fil_rev_8_21_14_0_20_36_8]|uniref:Uncharacterized protein n=2 Tax=Candidatus Roizmaniibacteriota TaxID=1752723 RepID=A0A2M6IT36_9BACT|nr:MAG: hypothetical protein COV58_04460 [Candidatus Roizmanbacteria bacterium CG11_big_fil_rev_8_21_14_0_20_36_8]PIZ66606.1 MAG: hypothetical protein COY14_00045 [Candidatus Roizmanbacteria bacterium CG_4_10_14_0_2_um_filter_36_9]